MKSRTSFFNFTAFKKDIFRFAPIWGLYTIFIILGLFLYSVEGNPAIVARDIVNTMQPMGMINLAYAGICVFFLFGDLFSSRMCNALHAFPVRREGWLTIHISAGILFALVPNLVAAGFACFLLKEYSVIALLWLAVSMLQYLFFFGTATLSAVCSGNRLGMVAVYGIIQFIMVPVYALAELIYIPLLYGIRLNTDSFWRFMPISRIMERDYVNFEYFYDTDTGEYLGVFAERWGSLGWFALVGVIALALSLVVYRKRHLEHAGDFISLKPLGPVFLVIYTLCVGILFYAFSELFDGNMPYLFLAIGLAVGFFTGLMLLRRTTKVFSKKAILGLAALAAVLVGSMGLTWLDPAGITRYIPETEDIAWAAFYSEEDGYLYREQTQWMRYEITDPTEMEKLQQFHQALAEERFQTVESWVKCDVQVLYVLKDGRWVTRYYTVPIDSELGQEAKHRFSDIRYILRTDDVNELAGSMNSLSIYSYAAKYNEKPEETGLESIIVNDPEQIQGFIDALKKDCAESKAVQEWNYHRAEELLYTVDTTMEEENYWQEVREIRIYESFTHTLKYLDALFIQYQNAQ